MVSASGVFCEQVTNLLARSHLYVTMRPEVQPVDDARTNRLIEQEHYATGT